MLHGNNDKSCFHFMGQFFSGLGLLLHVQDSKRSSGHPLCLKISLTFKKKEKDS